MRVTLVSPNRKRCQELGNKMRNGKGCATAQTRQVSHRVSPSHALFFLRQLLSISACYTGYPRGNDRKPSVFLEMNSTGDAGSSLLIRGCLIVSA